MSDFKAKMYQIQFRLRLRPRPAGGDYSAPPHPLAGLKGPTSKGRRGDGIGRGEGKGRNEKGRGRKGEGRGRDPTPSRPLIHISGYAPGPRFTDDLTTCLKTISDLRQSYDNLANSQSI